MTIDLKPCPFCGYKVEVRYIATLDGDEWVKSAPEIMCRICGLSMRFYDGPRKVDTPEELAERWNRR